VTTLASHALAESLAGAAQAVGRVIEGESLSTALVAAGRRSLDAAVQDLSFETLRDFGRGDALLAALVHKPLTDVRLRALLLVALREVAAARAADYTIVSQAVDAAVALGLAQAKGLVNGVLRRYLRERAALDRTVLAAEPARYRHPQWWIDRVRADHPDAWMRILEAGNGHPPMTLRVNRRRVTTAAYLERLALAGIGARLVDVTAIRLDKPRPVAELPGFADGDVSVQDAGAQRAATLLDVQDGQRVLDACAAPGGKAAHLLELADVELTAVDVDAARNRRVIAALTRLGLAARVVTGDAAAPATWWDGRPFDRILLDAPCTASGVVRRHPDIKWLRRASDVAALARAQSALLDALWQLLAPGGRMLYATCSVFGEENAGRIERFAAQHRDALVVSVPGAGSLLPDEEHDGFFYAALQKPQ
jgi:16S rRNA (cytosine967-C5)-methyltransferase